MPALDHLNMVWDVIITDSQEQPFIRHGSAQIAVMQTKILKEVFLFSTYVCGFIAYRNNRRGF